MNIHITNIYGFIQDQALKEKQNMYADAGHALNFIEMGIFNFDVNTDTYTELSKRLDGIISSLQFNDLVFFQLPTGNGSYYDNFLLDKIRAYNTKICIILHQKLLEDEINILNKADLILPVNDKIHRYLKNFDFDTIFYKNNINYEFPMVSNSSCLLSSDFYIKKYLIDVVDMLSEPVLDETDEDIIHIGFGLHDRDGHYSVWVGTAIQSIIEHTDSRCCFHILHDETLTDENKRKLMEVASQQNIVFHLMDTAVFDRVKEFADRFTIGSFFRCALPECLPGVKKIIYLDADVFVNKDIKELWDIDISNYCLAAVKDEGVNEYVYPRILKKFTNFDKQKYFNSGVLLMNLNKLKKCGNLIKIISDFIRANPESQLPDQDALNIIFSDSVLLLDSTWNTFVSFSRLKTKKNLSECIYHYAGDLLILYSGSKIDEEYFQTMCRTPWADIEMEHQFTSCFGRLNDQIIQYQKMLPRLCEKEIKHIFYGKENKMMKKLYKMICVTKEDYRVLKSPDNSEDNILPCKSLDALKQETTPVIIFVLHESDNNTAIKNLEDMGYKNEEDFFVIARFFSFYDGGFA